MRNSVTFEYDSKEALSPFLIPVYFNPNVLIKYLYDSRVSVHFSSETYGSIELDDATLPFGINTKGNIITWLGDLQSLPLADQHHWAVNGIGAQYDLRSEFYDAQISAQFTPPPLALQAINTLADWNAAFARTHGAGLYKGRSLEDRLEDARRYRRILVQSKDDFCRFASELNEIINESVDTAAVKAFLTAKGVQFPSGMKGNKLLELVYCNILGDTANLIAPFFMLYDLRIWSDHAVSDGLLKDVSTKLGVANLDDFEAIFSALLAKLHKAAQDLLSRYG